MGVQSRWVGEKPDQPATGGAFYPAMRRNTIGLTSRLEALGSRRSCRVVLSVLLIRSVRGCRSILLR